MPPAQWRLAHPRDKSPAHLGPDGGEAGVAVVGERADSPARVIPVSRANWLRLRALGAPGAGRRDVRIGR